MVLHQASEYNLATAILALLLLVATVVLWFFSLFKCRRRGDPARRGLRWMKLCGPLLCCYLLCFALNCVMEILFIEIGSDFSSDEEDYEYFPYAARFLAAFTDFFVRLTNAVIFLTLAHFGLGILHAAPSEPGKLQRPSVWAAKATAGVLGVIAVAALGVSLQYERDVIAYDNDKGKLERFQDVTAEELQSEALTVRRLSGALTILLFVASVASVAFSALVFLRVSKAGAHLKKVAIMLLSATILYFERNLFAVIIMGMYYDFNNLASALDVPLYLKITIIIFESAPLVLLLFVLFFLGQLKKGGLWSGGPAHGQPAPQHPQPPPQGYMGGAGQGQQPWYSGQAYQYGPQQPAGGVGYPAGGPAPSAGAGGQPAHPPPT